VIVPSADLEFAFALAEAADGVSVAHFRSEELRTTTKVDGTPVSEVDLAVEQAMVDLVRTSRGNNSILGEEVGAIAGTGPTGSRWIFDGIDGTHNYSIGRAGWATMIAYEVDGRIIVGMVSSPLLGRRWWAEAGRGAWTAPYGDDGRCQLEQAVSFRCGSNKSFAAASVIVTPFEGFLLGWRNEVPKLFKPPATPRSQCFALDAVMAATGAVDATIILLGGVWDYAATSLIVREAGGVFRDAWGGERLDTSSGLFTNADLIDDALAVLAEMRPLEPDAARVARTVSTPIGEAEARDADEWLGFGLRPLPSMSARVHVDHAPPMVLDIVDDRAAHLARPFVGVTTDGIVRPRAWSLGGVKATTTPITDAALAFVGAVTADQRSRLSFPIGATEWRMWINVHMNHFRHGLMLEDLSPPVRELALEILRSTLSARGFSQARSIMQINELLAELSGDYEAFGEWPYFMSFFGVPSNNEPWGWQIDGHHLCINAMVVDGQLVMTPTFMGSEPRRINRGRLAGTSLFDPEEALGLDLIRSFDSLQRSRAIIHPSIHPDHISPALQNAFDGRMQAGAFHDNLVVPYQGVVASGMTDGQRRLLLSLAGTYADWSANDHATRRKHEIEAHLDETWFSWYGGTDDVSPFYYRVHSPVILIEFDHHPGVVLDNEYPTRHHVHTVVRTPNGGDYGADLLREHHERFDHSHGDHDPHQ
jgi:fructose-1,6-bisphosphatase/inositol monophosphatase family enzyme